VVAKDGLFAWGANDEGQLGVGTTANVAKPSRVEGAFVAIAAGGYHSVARKENGSVWVWGAQPGGKLVNSPKSM